MGEYTFSEFKDYLQLRLGERDDIESKGGVNFLEVWVNAAYRKLAARNYFFGGIKMSFEFPELYTSTSSNTTDGIEYVSTPSDCLYVTEIYDSTNDRKLDRIDWKSYIGYTDRSDTSAEGEPTHWIRRGSNIYLHPTPDDTYSMTIHYQKIPAELSDASDTTVLGDEWDTPILELACYTAHIALGEYDKADRAKAEFMDQVQSLIGIYNREKQDMDLVISENLDSIYFDRG
jgi:hypothetical protein